MPARGMNQDVIQLCSEAAAKYLQALCVIQDKGYRAFLRYINSNTNSSLYKQNYFNHNFLIFLLRKRLVFKQCAIFVDYKFIEL